MKIGFLNLFPIRPHAEYMSFIAEGLSRNNSINILTCFNDFSSCHYKLWNDNHTLTTCLKCKIGSMAINHKFRHSTAISSLNVSDTQELSSTDNTMVLNSLANIKRIEKAEDVKMFKQSKEFELLYESKVKMAKVTNAWVKKYDLDRVILFNGRMDLMDSALRELKALGVKVITLESSNTDVGIRVHENASCVEFASFTKNLKKVVNFPLTRHQTLIAYSFYYNRLKNSNLYEWRTFAQREGKLSLNTSENFVLILPSSMYEFHGLIEDNIEWRSPIDGFDSLVKQYTKLGYSVILRFHPNWSRSVGRFSSNAESLYADYCESNDLRYFSSSSAVSTRELIKSATVVIVNGGSSAIEAALMLKQVVSVFPAKYNGAGFVDEYFTRGQAPKIVSDSELEKRRRRCLRYLFFNMRVAPSLQDWIKPITSFDYAYNYQKGLEITDISERYEFFDLYDNGSVIDEDEVIRLFEYGGSTDLLEKEYALLINNEELYYSDYEKFRQTTLTKIISTLRNLTYK